MRPIIQRVSRQRVANVYKSWKPVRNLVRSAGLPAFVPFWGGVLAHDFHNIRRCDGSSIWESFKKSARSEPMASVAAGNAMAVRFLPFAAIQSARPLACSTA
jgi:hypothetical protein